MPGHYALAFTGGWIVGPICALAALRYMIWREPPRR